MKNKIIIFMLAAILLIVLAGCKSSANQSYVDQFLTDPRSNSTDNAVYFKGRVVYENVPVKDAIVYIKNSSNEIRAEKKTDENGEITVIKSEIGKDIFLREYIFEIDADGFKSISENVDLRFSNSHIFSLEMKPEFSQNLIFTGKETIYSGKILEQSSTDPVENAFIKVDNKLYQTNSEGEFVIIAGSASITIERENYETATENIEINGNINVNKNIYLKSLTASIKGTVTENVENKKLSGVTVTLLKNNSIVESKTTDENGEFSFFNIKEEGNYVIRCEHNDYNEFNYSFSITETKDYVLSSFVLEGKKGVFRGRIIDVNTGDGIEGASVILGNGQDTITDSMGNFVITQVIPGNISVQVIADSYRNSTKTVFVEPNTTNVKNIFIQQEYGNSDMNIVFYTSDNKELDHNLVTVTFFKYPALLTVNEETNDFNIVYSEEYLPVDITFGESEASENGMNIINIFSGKYSIYAQSYISAENNTTGLTPGAYYGVVEDIIVSPDKTILFQMILGTDEVQLGGEEEEEQE